MKSKKRGPGRPPVPERCRREVVLAAKFTIAEARAVRRAAKMSETKVADFMRSLVLKALPRKRGRR